MGRSQAGAAREERWAIYKYLNFACNSRVRFPETSEINERDLVIGILLFPTAGSNSNV